MAQSGAAFFSACFEVQIVLSELIMGCLLDGGLGSELPIVNPF